MFYKLINYFVIIIISFSSVLAFSQIKPKTIENILSEIRQEQRLNPNESINAEKVSTEKLGELGNAIMVNMVNDSELYSQFNKNMSLDNANYLAKIHQKIGHNYFSAKHSGMESMMGGDSGMMGLGCSEMMNHWGWGYRGIFMGLIFMTLLLILLIVVIYFVVKSASIGNVKIANESTMEILKKRYAKGEISKDDFERMKKDL